LTSILLPFPFTRKKKKDMADHAIDGKGGKLNKLSQAGAFVPQSQALSAEQLLKLTDRRNHDALRKRFRGLIGTCWPTFLPVRFAFGHLVSISHDPSSQFSSPLSTLIYSYAMLMDYIVWTLPQ
jgi:hypothetical protein